MRKEITMESVFQAGYKAGYAAYYNEVVQGQDSNPETIFDTAYYNDRNTAWLDYVKELERE